MIQTQELIITDIEIRGKGVMGNPVRRVVQVYTKDGTLIAENDQALGTLLRQHAETLPNESARTAFLDLIQHVP